MSGISVHAVDVAAGRPAEGMRVEIFRLDPERVRIAAGPLAASGALDDPITRTRLEPGPYEVVLHVGEWLGATGFLDAVPIRFRIIAPDEHYHLPVKFTPWGYSVFRGS